MKKKILLINPWIHDFAAYDLWMKPLGLLYLAAIIKKNGCEVSLVNCLDWREPELETDKNNLLPPRKEDGRGKYPKTNIDKPQKLSFMKRRYCRYGISPGKFLAKLEKGSNPDLILVTSMMTYWYPGVFEAISLVKSVFPQVPVILGGIYATLCFDHAEKYSGADKVIAGPAETSLRKIFRDYLNFDLEDIPDINDFDSYPYPALELLGQIDCAPIMTSRGCPYRCTYCASVLLNEGFLQRRPEAVHEEITYWHENYHVEHFVLYDDAFLINPENLAIPLLHEIIKRKQKLYFHAPNGLHLREITSEIAHLLYKAGFKTIRFGFETAHLKQQRETGCKVYNEELIAAISYLKEAGYRGEDIGVYILAGLPFQREEELKMTIDFVKAAGVKPILAEYSPIPGTSLWNDALAASDFDLAGEPLFHNNTILPCRSESLTYSMYESLKRNTHRVRN